MRDVNYQGETIRLSKTYADFHEYRDDPNNLPASEIPRVEKLLTGAKIPARFPSREAANHFFQQLMFPGYGLLILQLSKPVGLYRVEIPRVEQERCVTVVAEGGSWFTIDDFIWPLAQGQIRIADYDGKRLTYRDSKGTILREK